MCWWITISGMEQARHELGHYSQKSIGRISCMEVMIGAETHEEEMACRALLSSFTILPITTEVAEKSIIIRKGNRIRMPEAIIWATAQQENCLVVTRNTRDFDRTDPGIRIPYSL